MRIILLCGPPCAGKTTLAYHMAGPDDTVIDFDDIARALGSPSPWRHPEPYLTMAEQEMQVAIAQVRRSHTDGTAWVIRSAPWPDYRARLAHTLDADVYLLDPGQAVCMRRAEQRPRGTRHTIGSWYHHYRSWSGDRDAAELTTTAS